MANDTTPTKRANSAYTFTQLDGKLVFDYAGIGRIEFDPARVSEQNRARAMMHGLKQRIVDAGAVEAGDNGKVDPVAKYEGMKRVADHLMSGAVEWEIRATAGGVGRASYVTRALMRLGTYQGRDTSTADAANAFVRELAESTAPAVAKFGFKGQVGKAREWLERNSKAIAAAIDEIRAEEAAGPAVDADEMLAGF